MYMLQATPTEILMAIRIWAIKTSSSLNITRQEQSNGLNSMALPLLMKEKASLWTVLDISTLPGILTVGFMGIQKLDTRYIFDEVRFIWNNSMIRKPIYRLHLVKFYC